MANTKISALSAMAAWASGDLVPMVDVSDTTQGAGGSTKKTTLQDLMTLFTGSTTLSGGTETTSKPLLDLSQTWNASGVSFVGSDINITNTASAAGSVIQRWRVGGTPLMSVTRTGKLLAGMSYSSATADLALGDANGGISFSSGATYFSSGGNSIGSVHGTYGLIFKNTLGIGWTAGAPDAGAADASFYRVAAAIMGPRGATSSDGGALSFIEQTAPSAPSTNGVYIYAQDNGGGKTQLMARFATGAAQQIAIEP